MNRVIVNIVLILLAINITSCRKPVESQNHQLILNEKGQKLVTQSNNFGIDIFKKVYLAEEEYDNIMVSPYSISMALGMTLNGANGETEDAMKATLGFSTLEMESINQNYKTIMTHLLSVDQKVKLGIANSIWQRQDFSVIENFTNINKEYFNAETTSLDFLDPTSVDIINNWCAEKTEDKITKVMDEISPEAVMFLINAIYFKGDWKYQFDEESVITGPFSQDDGTQLSVDMMTQEATLNYYDNELMQMIELPYGNEKFTMVVMLPKSGHNLNGLMEELNSNTFNQWMGNLQRQDQVIVTLPRFKFDYKKRLNEMLIDMGMGIAFNPGLADFSGISTAMGLFISFVDHFTFIDVNTQGTEAAAVTVVGIELTSAGEGNVSFTADHPFVFAITEKETNTILFIGTVTKPEYE
ncbi:MAG: serpin family protein [Bacteroidales bacterium]|nr:serpin family protein [Bacteroidales bacterium]